jgi:hypothetical protein
MLRFVVAECLVDTSLAVLSDCFEHLVELFVDEFFLRLALHEREQIKHCNWPGVGVALAVQLRTTSLLAQTGAHAAILL